jgi:hypothetical protein
MSKADLGVRMLGGNQEVMKVMIDNKWLGKKSGNSNFVPRVKNRLVFFFSNRRLFFQTDRREV